MLSCRYVTRDYSTGKLWRGRRVRSTCRAIPYGTIQPSGKNPSSHRRAGACFRPALHCRLCIIARVHSRGHSGPHPVRHSLPSTALPRDGPLADCAAYEKLFPEGQRCWRNPGSHITPASVTSPVLANKALVLFDYRQWKWGLRKAPVG
jgi:hypothetical protein